MNKKKLRMKRENKWMVMHEWGCMNCDAWMRGHEWGCMNEDARMRMHE